MCLSNDGILECIKYHNTCRKYSEDSKLLFPTVTKLHLSVPFESLSNKARSTMCPFINFEEIGKLPEWDLSWAVWLSFEWQHSSYPHFMWISISYGEKKKKTSSPILKRWRIWKQNNLMSYRQENVNIFCNLFSRFSHSRLWNSIMCDLWWQMVCYYQNIGISAYEFFLQSSILDSLAQYYQLLTSRKEPSLLLTMTSSLLGKAVCIFVKFAFTDWLTLIKLTQAQLGQIIIVDN